MDFWTNSSHAMYMWLQLIPGLCKHVYLGNTVFSFLFIISYLKYFLVSIFFLYVHFSLCSYILPFFLLKAIRVLLFFTLWESLCHYHIFCLCLYQYLIIDCTAVPEYPYFPLPMCFCVLAYSSISPFWAFFHLIFFIFEKYCSILPYPVMQFPDNQSAHSFRLIRSHTKFTEELTINCVKSFLYDLASAKSNVMGMIYVRDEPGSNTA